VLVIRNKHMNIIFSVSTSNSASTLVSNKTFNFWIWKLCFTTCFDQLCRFDWWFIAFKLFNSHINLNKTISRPQKEVPWINISSCYTSPSSCLAILFTWVLVVITFAIGKHFGLFDMDERGLEQNTVVCRKGKFQASHPHNPWDLFPWPQSGLGY
jgi:hypothetical protein